MAERRATNAFDVSLPVERVWEVVGDTQKLNELVFGLGQTKVVGRTSTAARLRGTFGRLAPEYDEFPWVFEVPRRYRSRRVFTGGLLRTLEVECILTPGDDVTRVVFEVVVDGRPGVLGSIATAVFLRSFTAGLTAVRGLLEGMQQRTGGPAWPPAHPHREAVIARLEPLLSPVRPGLVHDEQRALERLVLHLADATDADVARMRPYALADQWGLSRRGTLALFLRAAGAGALRLSWDLLCPACEGATTFSTLKDMPAGGHCPACDIDIRTDFGRNVEATFAPEPAVRHAERVVFCYGSPSSTPSWLAQFVVPPGATHSFATHLGVGRYRLQGQGIEQPLSIDVLDGDESTATLSSSAAAPASPRAACLTARIVVEGERARLEGAGALTAGPCAIEVRNDGAGERRVQLAWRAFASQAATAADVTGVGVYQDVFGAEALSADQQLAVGQRTILFTDLVGSTALYEAVGDAAAYGLVRRHFALLREAVEAHGGHVVKTVGDAVMAAFDLPIDGARAGLACIEALRRLRDPAGRPTSLRLRVGVHSGACLAVDANAHVDYFGRTVNLAARVEALGGADELVLSWTVCAAPDVAAFVDEQRQAGHTVFNDRRRVKGVAAEVDVVRVGVRTAT
jgi:class 3 adenylate cyclase